MDKKTADKRLEYLRSAIEAEDISYGEIAELASLAEYIDPSDVQLLEWAGIPEFPELTVNVTVDIGVTFTVTRSPGMLGQTLEAALARFMHDVHSLGDAHNVEIFRYDGDIDEAIGNATESR